MTSITDRLKQIRASLGLDQEKMAELLGMPARTYQDHEQGKNSRKFVFFETLAARGFSVDWLLTGTGDMKRGLPGLADEATPFEAHKPGGLRLNEGLLKIVVSEIELLLNEAGAELTPDKKAELVLAVYELALEQEDAERPVDRGKVVRLIRLAG